jgi:hypothetical protein
MFSVIMGKRSQNGTLGGLAQLSKNFLARAYRYWLDPPLGWAVNRFCQLASPARLPP